MLTTDCEKLEKAKALENCAKRFDKVCETFRDFAEKTKQLQKAMKMAGLETETAMFCNGLLDAQLRLNYLQSCIYCRLDEMKQDHPEPLDCRLCKRRVF